MSLKDFQFLGKLGQGAYCSVYKAKRLIDNEIYAIKKVKLNNLNPREQENALNEVRILASINHPNIISYKESFIEHTNNFLYIVMEFAQKGDLYERIVQHTKNNTKFSEEEVWSIAIQLTRGLKVLHDLKIMHRDLKSANVFMFNNGQVKLGDMNVSKAAKSMSKTQTGTPYYASPEVWKDLPYDKKSDMWSLGCVIYEAITLKPPFKANDMEGLYKKVTRGFYPRISAEYSQQLNLILKMLIEVTPHLRSTCDKILELPIVIKHHPCLPEHIHEIDDKIHNKLLETIKLSLDSKQQLSIIMPKPRYMNTIEYSARPRVKQEEMEETIKDFHKGSLKHQLNDQKLPKLGEKNRNEKNKSEKKIVNESYDDDLRLEKSSIRKFDPQTVVNQQKKDKKNKKRYSHNHEKGEDKRLPVILKGRLQSLSPSTIKRILKQQKQKQKVYSIIGNN